MPEKLTMPTFADFRAEQERVQATKYAKRLISDYNGSIFLGELWRQPVSCPMTDFLSPFNSGDETLLRGVIQGMLNARPDPAHWVEMGGGQGLVMRQFANEWSDGEKPIMTNVELRALSMAELDQKELEYLERNFPGMTDERHAPDVMFANVEMVTLPRPADLITSVEVMQYLNSPLEAICNWYNQLSDGGHVIISTEHDWSSWIRYRYEQTPPQTYETPTKHLLEALGRAGIAYAASREADTLKGVRPKLDPGYFRNLAIRKKPGTKLVVNSPLVDIWVNDHDYKAAYYEAPRTERARVIEVAGIDPKEDN